ncbi:efflux RND transporter periplasmic adaptor subunit [Legionella oakridgensis]|uniref:RND family efflux transporter, MFP subunit n=2 Tax=Legionella oakridgensis TaxID=29423 RepID=W0BH38_9GAMM|nr:efflux RND transporter periplasmic adaptor subunit [Legionella oakridgensis]AHE68036.1 RND family efflux transporter, MFP subunit [Legionella oakridgensis ATCC 33761 = DSM 21215]KTD44564.1 multidrug efflux system, subunit A [Legionella oakridgensis]STY21025.1 multidrug efflux system, subunit A [Legionella longbeachae]
MRQGLGCILCGFLILFSCQATYSNPIAVTATVLSSSEKTYTESFLGVIQPKEMALVQAKTSGQIKEIYFYPGDEVKKNEILLQIDKTNDQIKLDIAEEMYSKALVAFNTETFNFKRAESLYANKAIPESEFKAQKLEYQSALSALNNAKSNLELAKLNLSYTSVTSPISGKISEKKVLAHSVVEIGTPLYVITSTQKLIAVIPIPESLRSKLSSGLTTIITNQAAHESISAKIRGIDPISNEKNHSVNVYIDFDNPGTWYPGNTVSAKFRLSIEKGFSVPQESIVYHNGFPEIYVINQNKANALKVKETIMKGSTVWIQGPLKNGMTIAVSGAANLYDGATVTIVNQNRKNETH